MKTLVKTIYLGSLLLIAGAAFAKPTESSSKLDEAITTSGSITSNENNFVLDTPSMYMFERKVSKNKTNFTFYYAMRKDIPSTKTFELSVIRNEPMSSTSCKFTFATEKKEGVVSTKVVGSKNGAMTCEVVSNINNTPVLRYTFDS